MEFQFLQTVIGYLKSLKPSELILFFGYPLLFLLSTFLLKWIVNKRKVKSAQERASFFAVDALLFAILGIFIFNYLEDPILKILFRDMFISLTALALAGSVFSVVQLWWSLRILTYVGLVLALLVEFVIIFSTDIGLIKVLIPVRKFLILVSVYPIGLALVELIQLKRLQRVLTFLYTSLFVLIGILWELNIVDFDTRAFIGIGIFTVASLIFSWYVTQGVVLLKKKLKEWYFDEEDSQPLISHSKRLAFLVLLYVYWSSSFHFFNFESVALKLKEWTFIDTNVVRISLYNLLIASYIFAVLYSLINLLKKALKLLFKPEEREEKGGALETVVYNLGILFAVSVFLVQLGLTWKVILPLAGALGIGLGFGLQTILNNYVSGFIMMLSKNIKVGDFVELPGNAGNFVNNTSNTIFGRVEDISVLTTRIKTLDGIDILVPNSTFIGQQIINYSFRNPYVRVRFPFGVAYSSDPQKVKEILLDLAYKCPWAKNYYKPPQVWFYKMDSSALIFHLMFWIDIRELWRSAHATLSYSLTDWVYTNGWYKLKEAGIEIPFPQNDLWFRNELKVVLEKEDGTPLAFLENRPPRGGKEDASPKGKKETKETD